MHKFEINGKLGFKVMWRGASLFDAMELTTIATGVDSNHVT